jgi:diaminopimelate decarboxylase
MLELPKSALKRMMITRLRAQDSKRRQNLPAEFGGLPPSLWGWEAGPDGQLALHRHGATELAHRFGTPLHIVSLAWLRRTHDNFLGAFRASYPNCQLATSYKTNPLPVVLQALHDCGTYAEVISAFELWLAERLGLPGERIIVNGPGKDARLIGDAVRIGAKVINMDGPGEIDLIAAAAERQRRRQAVGVRVVTSVGWSSQFGLSIAEGAAMEAFKSALKNPALLPTALHLHLGTGIKSVALYLRAVEELLAFAAQLRRELGIAIRLLDLGGGFGVPTVRAKDDWDRRMIAAGYPPREAIPSDCPAPQAYAEGISHLLNRHFPRPDDRPEVVFEPGRAITSSAQTLLLRVLAVKLRHGVRQIILDGGKNVSMPLEWETHKIFAGNRMSRPHSTPTDLFGPLCHPGDVVARHLLLPELQVGDLIAIMDAGAYFIPNQMNFSNPRPAVVAIDEGVVRLSRTREGFEDIVRLDTLPPLP